MNKILPKFFTAAVLCFGMLSAHADNITIKLATSLSPGAKLTFGLPLNTRVSVDWGNGEVISYRDSVVTGTLAGDTVIISGTSQLSSFDCHEQNVKWLDITQAPDLVSLDCSYNELTELDLTKNTSLEELDCSYNQIKTLSLTKSSGLRSLDCEGNGISSLNIIPNNSLEMINVSDNQISTLTLRTKNKLRAFWGANNKLTMLSFSNYAPMQTIVCPENNISLLTLTEKSQIEDFWITGNKISEVDLSTSDNLKTLDVSNNQLDTLALSKQLNAKNPAQYINCSENHLSFRSIYNRDITNTYICGNQTYNNVPDTVAAAIYVDFSRFITNASGRKNGTISLYNGEDDSMLKTGSSAAYGDYSIVSSVGRVKFFKNFDKAYIVITGKDYPDLSIRTKNFVVYDEGIANGIEDIKTSGGEIIAETAGNVLLLSSARSQNASVVSTDGAIVWQGKVSATPVEISLVPGVYVVGQKKIVIQ